VIKSDSHLSMHDAYALGRVENWFSNHRCNQLAICCNGNSLWFLSSLPDASGKSLLRKLGFRYMLSPMVAYTSRIIMQAIPARVITNYSRQHPILLRVLSGISLVRYGTATWGLILRNHFSLEKHRRPTTNETPRAHTAKTIPQFRSGEVLFAQLHSV